MDRTSLYRALAPMQRQGWIRLTQGQDGRSRTAQLTREGKKALQQAGDRWEEIQARIVHEFGVKRWSALVSEMETLADAAVSAKKSLEAEIT